MNRILYPAELETKYEYIGNECEKIYIKEQKQKRQTQDRNNFA